MFNEKSNLIFINGVFITTNENILKALTHKKVQEMELTII